MIIFSDIIPRGIYETGMGSKERKWEVKKYTFEMRQDSFLDITQSKNPKKVTIYASTSTTDFCQIKSMIVYHYIFNFYFNVPSNWFHGETILQLQILENSNALTIILTHQIGFNSFHVCD